jgi:hypothetical protein
MAIDSSHDSWWPDGLRVVNLQDSDAADGADENVFDAKMDKGSSDLYFHYYGMLQHQQNMLQVREGGGLEMCSGYANRF